MNDPSNTKSYTTGFQFFQCIPNIPKDPSLKEFDKVEAAVFGFNFHQMSAAAGIRKHGGLAQDTMLTEAKQLMDLEVFHPFDCQDMTNEERLEICSSRPYER